jgi:hypothetical protein
MLVKPLITLSKPVRNALSDEGGKLLHFIEPDAKSHVVDFER